MIAPGGTPSVKPESVATYAGRPPTITLSEVDPGSVDTTIVHGFVLGLGGCAQPATTAPTRSGSQRTAPPPHITCIWRGIRMTCPPWAQRIWALLVTTGGMRRGEYL